MSAMSRSDNASVFVRDFEGEPLRSKPKQQNATALFPAPSAAIYSINEGGGGSPTMQESEHNLLASPLKEQAVPKS